MKRAWAVVVLVTVLGCGADDEPTAPAPDTSLVGVWRAVSVDGEPLPWRLPSGEDVVAAQVVLADVSAGPAMLGLWQECLRTETELGSRDTPSWHDLHWEPSGEASLRITWQGPDAAYVGIQDDGAGVLGEGVAATLTVTRTAGVPEPGAEYRFERISEDPDDRGAICEAAGP